MSAEIFPPAIAAVYRWLASQDRSPQELTRLLDEIEILRQATLDRKESLEVTFSGSSRQISGTGPWKVWSDGACSGNPGKGGWGTIVRNGTESTEFSGAERQTTNNRMELIGAIEGLRRTPAGAEVELYSDSRYLVDGMRQWIHGWKKKHWKKADGNPVLNRDLWQALDAESAQRRIRWFWVRGHLSNEMNNRCDALARQAAASVEP